MVLQEQGFFVTRRQRFDEGWREWSNEYPAHFGVHDPVSLIFSMRTLDGEGPWEASVFDGTRTWPVQIKLVEVQHLSDTILGPVDVRVLEASAGNDNDRIKVTMTNDERSIPIKIQVHAGIGTIRANLVEYEAPRDPTGLLQ